MSLCMTLGPFPFAAWKLIYGVPLTSKTAAWVLFSYKNRAIDKEHYETKCYDFFSDVTPSVQPLSTQHWTFQNALSKIETHFQETPPRLDPGWRVSYLFSQACWRSLPQTQQICHTPEQMVLGAQTKNQRSHEKGGDGLALENFRKKDGQDQYKPVCVEKTVKKIIVSALSFRLPSCSEIPSSKETNSLVNNKHDLLKEGAGQEASEQKTTG